MRVTPVIELDPNEWGRAFGRRTLRRRLVPHWDLARLGLALLRRADRSARDPGALRQLGLFKVRPLAGNPQSVMHADRRKRHMQ